jgi:hypothetical protein
MPLGANNVIEVRPTEAGKFAVWINDVLIAEHDSKPDAEAHCERLRELDKLAQGAQPPNPRP